MGVSSSDFDKKCKELVPQIEAKVKEQAPNVISVKQYFYLQAGLCLNLAISYKNAEGTETSFPLRVGCNQVMNEDIEPVIAVIVKAATE